MTSHPTIGFIGQGWIGKNYANDFEKRGFSVVRYALEEPYVQNKDAIRDCDIVFVAVPTPTTPSGFDDSIVRSALKNIGLGKTVVIKSTLKPGTTEMLQKDFPEIFIMHSPEFLSRGTAAQDVEAPFQNIIGIPLESDEFKKRAKEVLAVLPNAPSSIIPSQTAELFKYIHNTSLFVRGVYMNLLFDIATTLHIDWKQIMDLIIRDPMIAFQDPVVAKWHIEPMRKEGRGVGGDCHIKDFATLESLYREKVGDEAGVAIMRALEKKNLELLISSHKDLDLVAGVYGKDILEK